MKKIVSEFFRRGMFACGIGPIVLALIYLILQREASLESLTVKQVCIGIFSLSSLAFIAGGMNIVYQIERLPLMLAISVHGFVLYVSYLIVYLINGWLKQGTTPFFIFTFIFIIGYLSIWAIIYCITRRNTARVNKMLKMKQDNSELASN